MPGLSSTFAQAVGTGLNTYSSGSLTLAVTDSRCNAEDIPMLLGNTVSVLVGHTQTKYVLHEHLLRASSSFFATALSDLWKETEEGNGVIRLPEEDAENFHIYARWLYFDKLAIHRSDDAENDTASPFQQLLELYVMGARLMDTNFQNIVINSFIAEMWKKRNEAFHGRESYRLPTQAVIEELYRSTNDGDPLRMLVVHSVAKCGMALTTNNDDGYRDFVNEVAQFTLSQGYRRDYIKIALDVTSTCRYHHHEEGETCESRKRKRIDE